MGAFLEADRLPLLLVAAALGLVGVMALRRYPRAAFLFWAAILVFVPTWISLPLPVLIQPAALLGIFLCLSLLPVELRTISLGDLGMLSICLLCLIASLISPAGLDAPFRVITLWLVGYSVGRLAPLSIDLQWIYQCIAVIFTILAVVALIEFLRGVNPFLDLVVNNNEYKVWGTEQFRAGRLRVEASFGHSIALGSSLALVIPIIMTSRFPWAIRVAMTFVVGTAVILTFSRIAMLCAVLGLVLTLCSSNNWLTARQRIGSFLVLAAVGTALLPTLLRAFADAGQEATGSADYRTRLLTLIPNLHLLGLGDGYRRAANGVITFGTFRSIDNALLLIGLTFGLLPVLLGLLMATYAVLQVLRLRASPPMSALVAHLPALVSVAFITQYTMVFWLIVGLAAAQQVADRATRSSCSQPASLTDRTPRPDLPALGKGEAHVVG